MSKHRQLNYGQPVPQDFLDALQEFVGTMSSRNLALTMVPGSANQVQIIAGSGSDQVSLGIDGLWRYITVSTQTTVTGAAGTYDIFVTTGNNAFATNPTPPPPETDSTDYTFALAAPLLQGSTPSAPHYRKVGEAIFDGTRILSLRQTVGYDAAQLAQPGDLKLSAAASPPAGWLVCDGRTVSRTSYAALYAALGGPASVWGQGDGSTTFNLPDLRGKAPLGAGQGTYPGATARALGSTGGVEGVALTWDQSGTNGNGVTGSENANHAHSGTTAGDYPDHAHMTTAGGAGAFNNISGNFTAKGVGHDYTGGASTPHQHNFGTSAENAPHQHALVSRNADNPHTNMPPWVAVNYWIKF